MQNYIVDTNVIISNPLCAFNFTNSNIIMPIHVLEELDKLKVKSDNTGFRARKFFRFFKKIEQKGNLFEGILIDNNNILKTKIFSPEDNLPQSFDKDYTDNKILSMLLQEKYNSYILLTNDVSMRVKASALGIKTKLIDSSEKHKFSELYDGILKINVTKYALDSFYKNKEISLHDIGVDEMHPNQFFVGENEQGYGKIIGRYSAKDEKVVKLHNENIAPYGIAPKDLSQKFAYEALLHPDIPFITITSRQGCGKTLLAMAAALEMTIEQNIYSKILIGKDTAPIDKWNYQGFTTGDTEEKLITHFGNYITTLENIQNIQNKSTRNGLDILNALKNRNKLDVLDISSILGSSFVNKIIIIDEAQSFDIHAMRSIITRIGKNCKLILIGDIGQQTIAHVDPDKSGFYAAIQWLKTLEETAHITLKKVHRGSFVEKASKIFDDNMFG